MHIITTQHPEFGKGYFIGFENGSPVFQSCYDKRVKDYRDFRNAGKQLSRITAMPNLEGETYAIESTLQNEYFTSRYK